MENCTKIYDLPFEKRCDYAKIYCISESLVPINYLYFCPLNQNLIVASILGILFASFLFYCIGVVAERFVVPKLLNISKTFNISHNLTAITFLAFGNGAADLITSWVAAGKSGEDAVYFSIGAIIGASVFITLFLAPLMVFCSPTAITMGGIEFGRDMTFYFFSLLLILVFSMYGSFTFLMGLILFLMYILYVIISVFIEWLTNRRKKLQLMSYESKLIDKIQQNQIEEEHWSSIMIQETNPKIVKYVENIDKCIKNDYLQIHEDKSKFQPLDIIEPPSSNSIFNILWWNLKKAGYFFVSIFMDPEWNEKGYLGRILYIIFEGPVSTIVKLTLPPSENWDRRNASLSPIFAFLLIMVVYELYEDTIVIIVASSIALLLAIFTYFTSHRSKMTNIVMKGVLAVFGFLISLIWLQLIAEIVIDIFYLINIISGLPLEFTAITLLAIGASTGDLVASVVLARSGKAVMAIIGCYSGALFNLLLGFGLCMMKYDSLFSPPEFSIKHFMNHFPLFFEIILGALFCALFFIALLRTKFRFVKILAYLQMAAYIIMLIVMSFSLKFAK